MKRYLIIFALLITVLLPAVAFVKSSSAAFNANNIIDDSVFDNYNSMNAQQIDAFLNNNFPSSCISTRNGFTAPALTGYNPSAGYTYGGNVSAGQVIAAAAQAYKINPQVIIATLEKESSVVSGTASYHCQYINTSMGYDCPDNGACPRNPATESGFSKQIIHAVWLMKFDQQHANGNYNWAEIHDNWDNSDDIGTCYSGPMTQGVYKRGSSGSCNQLASYDGLTSIDGNTVHLDTGATAALYHYTPHFHGNQLFVSIFESWFGPTQGEGYALVTSYQDNGDTRQWAVYKGVRHLVPNTDTLKAWGLDKLPLLQWNGSYLGSFPVGKDISRLMRPSGSQDVYFVDNGNCYRIPSTEMLSAWGFNPAAIVDVSTSFSQVPTNLGALSYSVRNASVGSGPVYMVDGGATRQYQNADILNAWEGDNPSITALSNDYISAMGSGTGLSGTKINTGATTKEYQVSAGQKLLESTPVTQLYPGVAQSVSTATINRLGNGPAASQFIRAYNGTTIYMVDGGTKHAVATPEIVKAWNNGTNPSVNLVTQGNLNLLPNGTALTGYEADLSGQLYLMDSRKIAIPTGLDSSYRTSNVYSPSTALMSLLTSGGTATGFLKGFNSPGVYLMDAGSLRQVRTPNNLSLLSGDVPPTSVSDYVLSHFANGPTTGSFVTDGSTNYLMADGQKHVIDSTAKANWRLGTPDTLNSATLARFGTGAPVNNKLQASGAYFYVLGGVAYGTVDRNIAEMWGVSDAPNLSTTLIKEYLGGSMMTRIVKSTIPGDSRLFIIDRGILYHLYPNHALNLGTQGPYSGVDPSAMSVYDWTAAVVKDEGGSPYVIDSATKRLIPRGIIRDQWTFGNYNSIPTMTNGFLNTLPTSVPMERAIKGSGPSVYSVENINKRWIQNANLYASKYAPYTVVSDNLLGIIPDGPSL